MDKAVVLAEPHGFIVNGLDHEVAGADGAGVCQHALVGVELQSPAKGSAVEAPVERELAE